MATEALVLSTQSAIEQMQDVLDQNYLRAWKFMSLSDPKPDKLRAILPKINRMFQNVNAMLPLVVMTLKRMCQFAMHTTMNLKLL